ncbi:MAG: T9SS type A sorting domain-containing protein [Bacteroidales bacterium]|nr:T9SS type A sorting domain-containing protein [Bacteroidales bacterium]MCF8336861.1 T9SS type A sorting domain-containing protein [Bacteroidales bacterium]
MKKQKLFTLLIPIFFVFGNVGIGQPSNYYMNPDFGPDNTFNIDDPVAGIENRTFQATSTNQDFYIEWDSEYNEWYNTGINLNEEFVLTFEGQEGLNHNSSLNTSPTNGSYYTIQIEGLAYSDRNAVIMETSNSPQSFAASTPVSTPSNVYPGQSVTINVNLAGSKSSEEKVFVRYSDDGFSTSAVTEATNTGDTWSTASATIPAGTNTSGTTVEYYAYTTTVSANNSSNHDLITLEIANNSGNNYSYTVEDSWTTSGSGDGSWDDSNAWDAGEVPVSDQPVTIQNNITLDQNASVSSLTIENGVTFTASDGSNRTLTIQDGGTLTNNGTFTASDGSVSFAGGGTISGSITFNTIDISGGVDFGSSSTVNGTLTVKAGGFANNNAPTYGGSSTLLFDTGGSYTIDGTTTFWTTGSNLGQGVPNDVTVNSTSPLNIYEARDVTGKLTINSNGSVEQGNNTFIVQGNLENSGSFSFASDGAERLVIQGNLVNHSGASITLSNTIGGDMQLEGDYQSDGTVNFNNRAIFFEGGNAQSVTGANDPINFDYLYIAKSGGTVTFNQNVLVNDEYDQSGGDAEISSTTTLEIGASAIADVGTGTTLTTNGNLTIKSDASSTGSLIVKGTLSGNATAQRYIAGHSGDNTTGWHLLSPPIGTFTINNNADFDPGNNDDVYGWSESSYTWMNHKQGNPSDMVPGTGYLVSYESTATKNFTGTLNNSDITRSNLSVNPDGNGWHLLGNPFPSALHWEEDGDWSINNFASGAKIMNPGGSYTDISTGGANQYIPAHQGFFVQATTDGSNSITIPKADREHNSTSFYKSEVNNLLTLKASQGNKYVETWLQMKEGATVDYDEEYDIHFLGGMEGTPYLYSIADNEEYVSTNRIPHDISDTEIPLGFKVFNDGEVTMEWKNLDSFENDVALSLTDLKTEKTINLDESDSYTFTASTEDDVNRFVLNFKSAIGIDEQSDELEGVSIYSHDNRIFVNSGDELTNAELSVYNTLGQLVSRESYKSGDKVISIDQRGAYIVRIQAEEGVATEKVIIR